jgi:putative SOS response-associated peptidase YedK
MCGRYGRCGDKQKIAEAFHVKVATVDFAEDEDARLGSIQPVVMVNKDGERDFANMRWGFKLPDRLLSTPRSDTAATSKFCKEKLAEKRCVIPASSSFDGKVRLSVRLSYLTTNTSGRRGSGILGKTRRQRSGMRR